MDVLEVNDGSPGSACGSGFDSEVGRGSALQRQPRGRRGKRRLWKAALATAETRPTMWLARGLARREGGADERPTRPGGRRTGAGGRRAGRRARRPGCFGRHVREETPGPTNNHLAKNSIPVQGTPNDAGLSANPRVPLSPPKLSYWQAPADGAAVG